MTNPLINLAPWNSPRLKDLAQFSAGPAHVFLASLNTPLAVRKQSIPTGIPQ
jgi:hypothetical protein